MPYEFSSDRSLRSETNAQIVGNLLERGDRPLVAGHCPTRSAEADPEQSFGTLDAIAPCWTSICMGRNPMPSPIRSHNAMCASFSQRAMAPMRSSWPISSTPDAKSHSTRVCFSKH